MLDIDHLDIGVSWGLIEWTLPLSPFEFTLAIEEVELGPAIRFDNWIPQGVLAFRNLQFNDKKIIGVGWYVKNIMRDPNDLTIGLG